MCNFLIMIEEKRICRATPALPFTATYSCCVLLEPVAHMTSAATVASKNFKKSLMVHKLNLFSSISLRLSPVTSFRIQLINTFNHVKGRPIQDYKSSYSSRVEKVWEGLNDLLPLHTT